MQRAQADGPRPRHVLRSIVHEQAGGAIRPHDIEGDLVDPCVGFANAKIARAEERREHLAETERVKAVPVHLA